METEKLKALIYSIELKSFTAAGEKLGYTTGGISKMMSALEKEIELKLLSRSKEGILPTEECKILLPYIREILNASYNCENAINKLLGMETGSITIGVAYGAYYTWLSQSIAKFSSKYPKIKINTIWGNSSELCTAIKNNEVDIAIISRRDISMPWIHLKSDELLVALPKSHKLNELGYAPTEILASTPFIELNPNEETDNSIFFKQKSITPNIYFTCNDSLVAYSMVEAGLGITLLNSIVAEPLKGEVSLLPLNPRYFIDIGITFKDKKNISYASNKFIEFLQSNIDKVISI